MSEKQTNILRKNIFPIFFLFFVTVLFFNKTILFSLIPFPGDLLLSEYQPFRSYSYFGFAPGAIPNKAQYFDAIREFYPWRTLSINELKNGSLPLWNPYNFSGTPHFANYQTAILYPLNIIYLILPQTSAWSILIIIQPLLASLFMYLFLKKLSISSFGSIVGAIAFAFSSYMNIWSQFQVVGHTLLWLPLILFGIELIIENQRIRNLIIPVFGILCSLFAGHPLDFLVVLIFSLIYGIIRIIQDKNIFKIALLFKLFLVYLISIGIGLIQLIPTIQLLNVSTRAPFSYKFLVNNLLIQPIQLIMMLVPDYFGNPATRNYFPQNSYVGITLSSGIIVFILAVSIIFTKRVLKQKSCQYIYIFLFTAIVSLFLMVRHPITELLYKIQIPIISTIQPNKLQSLFIFSLAVLSSFGIDAIKTYKNTKQLIIKLLFILTVLCIPLFVLFFIPDSNRIIALKQSVICLLLALAGLSLCILMKLLKQFEKICIFGIIGLIILEQYYAFQKFNPFSPKEYIYPQAEVIQYLQQNTGIDRIWGYGTAKIDSNIATQFGLFSPDGFDALNINWYNKLISASKDGRLNRTFDQSNRSIAEIATGYGEFELPDNQYRLRILDVFGVKYILDRVENPRNAATFPQDRFLLIWEDNAGWKIFENKKSAPRYFLTNSVQYYSSDEEFENLFFSDTFNPKKDILLDIKDKNSTIILCSDNELTNSKISLITYSPKKINFSTSAKCNSYLQLSDTYYPSWKVFIDGEKKEIFRSDYAFRAVLIPEGNHTVNFLFSF